jgi:hypothetical protein
MRSDAYSSERQLVISLGHRQATLPSGLDVPLRVACCFGQSECDGTCKTIVCNLAMAMTFPGKPSPRRRQFLGFGGMQCDTVRLGFQSQVQNISDAGKCNPTVFDARAAKLRTKSINQVGKSTPEPCILVSYISQHEE